MKFIYKIFTLLFISAIGFATAQSTGIEFDKSEFSQLLAKAKDQNKMIFVDAFAEWCGPCKLMAKNVFTQDKVGGFYNDNFINAQIDMEKGEGRELAAKYQVHAYPTYLFIDGDGTLVHKAIGYLDGDSFIDTGKKALNPNETLNGLQKRYEEGDRSPDLLKNLAIETLYKDPVFSQKVVEEYLSNKKIEDYDKIDLQLLLMGIKSAESPNYKIFYEGKEELINKFLSQDTYEAMDVNIHVKDAYQKYYDPETDTLDQEGFLKSLSEKVGKGTAESVLQNYLERKEVQ